MNWIEEQVLPLEHRTLCKYNLYNLGLINSKCDEVIIQEGGGPIAFDLRFINKDLFNL